MPEDNTCNSSIPSTTVFSGCLWTLTIYRFSQISTITKRSFPYKQWNLHILKLNYFGSSNKSIQMQQKKSLNQYQRFCDSHKIEKYKSLYIFYNFFFPEPIFLVSIFLFQFVVYTPYIRYFRHDPSFTFLDTWFTRLHHKIFNMQKLYPVLFAIINFNNRKQMTL